MSPMTSFPNMNSNLPRGPVGEDGRPWPSEDKAFRRQMKLAKLTLTCIMLMTAATCGYAQDGAAIAEKAPQAQTQVVAQK